MKLGKYLSFLLQLTILITACFAGGLFVAIKLGYADPITPYVVLSGSMAPKIKTGSVVLVAPKPFGYMPGEIITFNDESGQNTTTHRITALKEQSGQIVYQTKGDANKSTDQGLVKKDQVIGSVRFSAPYLGYLVDFAKKPIGFILLVIIPATIIVYEEFKTIVREIANLIRRIKKRKHRKVVATKAPLKTPSHLPAFLNQARPPASQTDDSTAGSIPTLTYALSHNQSETSPAFTQEAVSVVPPTIGSHSSLAQAGEYLPLAPLPPESITRHNKLLRSYRELVLNHSHTLKENVTQTIQTFRTAQYSERVKKAFIVVPAISVAAISVGVTGSHFFDSEVSAGNILGAATQFVSPDPTPTPGPAPTPTSIPPTAIPVGLVINEVLPDSSCAIGNDKNSDKAAWIEIYNGSRQTVNLKNVQITDGIETIGTVNGNNHQLEPGKFILLSHDSALWSHCFDPNGAQTANLGSNNFQFKTGLIALLTENGQVIDTFKWSGASGINPILDESVERVPSGRDTAAGIDFEPDDAQAREKPTPGYGTSIVINELLVRPSSLFTEEWVEIYNFGPDTLDLTDWKLKDGSLTAESLSQLGVIKPGGFAVLSKPGDDWLNNTGGEVIQLINPFGQIVDQHTFSNTWVDKSHGRQKDGLSPWKNCIKPSQGSVNTGKC